MGEGFLEITRFLLKTFGIEKNRIDHDGRTPLSYAAGSGQLDMVNLLAEDAEVALDTRDSSGRTALDWATLGQHDSVIQKLDSAVRSRYMAFLDFVNQQQRWKASRQRDFLGCALPKLPNIHLGGRKQAQMASSEVIHESAKGNCGQHSLLHLPIALIRLGA